MNYEQAINYIDSTYKLQYKFEMDNITRITELLDNPQNSYKIIHVAGTNGKGSTSNMIHDVLVASGYKVGLFVSPHLEKFTERIQINKTQIDESSLVRITSLIKDKNDIMIEEGYSHLTQFELITAIGFKYFEEQKIDFLVLEVGVGGRFDATNIVINSLVSVITSISYDHEDFLGNTLEEIAFEKAGIIKENGNVVVYPQDDIIKNVIKKQATSKNAIVFEADAKNIEKIKCNFTGQWFKYLKTDIFNCNEIRINYLGTYQIYNALTALTALELIKKLGFNITEESIIKGLDNSRYAGRFEILSKEPMIIIDGGHNKNGIEYFAKSIMEYFNGEKIKLFYGMLEDKHPESVIDYLVPISKEIYTLTPKNSRAMSSQELSKLIKIHSNIKVTPIEDNNEILDILKNVTNNEVVAFVGSLYLIGEIRNMLVRNLINAENTNNNFHS